MAQPEKKEPRPTQSAPEKEKTVLSPAKQERLEEINVSLNNIPEGVANTTFTINQELWDDPEFYSALQKLTAEHSARTKSSILLLSDENNASQQRLENAPPMQENKERKNARPKTKTEPRRKNPEKSDGLNENAQEVKNFLDSETKRVEEALAQEQNPEKRERLENEKAILEIRQREFERLAEREKEGFSGKTEKEKARKIFENLNKKIDDATIERYLAWKKQNADKAKIDLAKAEEKPITIEKEISPETVAQDLDAIREAYLEAKRVSGNWRRKGEIKVKIKGEEKTFKNKEVKAALPAIGEEYNRLRAEYIRNKVRQEITAYQGENIKQEIVNKLCDSYLEEEGKNEALIEKRDKTLGTRFREWYRRHPYARMGISYGLSIGTFASLATGQLYLTPWLVAGRAGLAGISATMGTEAIISKYSKKLGERGIAGEKTLKEISKLSPDQAANRIHAEIAALTALQERKGKKMEQAGPRETIVTALREMEREAMRKKVESAMQEGNHSKEALLTMALNAKLDTEAREKDKLIESFGDQEREKSIKRWKYSFIMGASASGLTAGIGLYRWKHAAKLASKIPGAKTILGKILGKAENTDFKATARPGDSVWKIAKRGLAEKYGAGFTNLDQARQTYIIDAVKDRIATNPAAFGLQDVDILKPGQSMDLGKIFSNQEGMENFFQQAKNLSHGQIQNILKNNETLANFHKTHPDVFMDSEKVDQILSGRKGIPAPDAAISQENILENKPPAAIPETEIVDETPAEKPVAKPEVPETSVKAPEIDADLPPKMQTMIAKLESGQDIDPDITDALEKKEFGTLLKTQEERLSTLLKEKKSGPNITKIYTEHIQNKLSPFDSEDKINLQHALDALEEKIASDPADTRAKISQKMLERMAVIGIGREE